MSVMKKTMTAGLVALSVAGALAATAPAAEARDRDIGPGIAAGVAGALIGGAIAAGSQRPVYDEPEYAPPRVYYRTQYRPRCHYEWVENDYGDTYRARVCARY